jgi:hypothetical protein
MAKRISFVTSATALGNGDAPKSRICLHVIRPQRRQHVRVEPNWKADITRTNSLIPCAIHGTWTSRYRTALDRTSLNLLIFPGSTPSIERECILKQKNPRKRYAFKGLIWLRGQDLNLRPSGYEPDELPGCSTPRQQLAISRAANRFALTRENVISRGFSALGRPGDDLLSRVLRHSTIGAKAFDGRVRDGIGSGRLAKATRPAKDGK